MIDTEKISACSTEYEVCDENWDLSTNFTDSPRMLSGCELIDTENISMPRQNMKFVVE
jgi:hypothetical protein